MTQESKELLFKDLCARLSYNNLIVRVTDMNDPSYQKEGKLLDIRYMDIDCNGIPFLFNVENVSILCDITEIKPYLRPMSSMTEEEKKDILQSLKIHGDIDNEGNLILGVECDIITLKVCKKYFGELNKRMFDVCHMIEKGLALEEQEGMYNIKEK